MPSVAVIPKVANESLGTSHDAVGEFEAGCCRRSATAGRECSGGLEPALPLTSRRQRSTPSRIRQQRPRTSRMSNARNLRFAIWPPPGVYSQLSGPGSRPDSDAGQQGREWHIEGLYVPQCAIHGLGKTVKQRQTGQNLVCPACFGASRAQDVRAMRVPFMTRRGHGSHPRQFCGLRR